METILAIAGAAIGLLWTLVVAAFGILMAILVVSVVLGLIGGTSDRRQGTDDDLLVERVRDAMRRGAFDGDIARATHRNQERGEL